jgi:hypothetical protein
MRYRLEQRIDTLAENAVIKDGRVEAAFVIGQTKYSHWDFDPNRGWPTDAWLAEASIDAANHNAAFQIFRENLNRVVPRISLVSQTYTDFLPQPLLIVRDGEQVGFFRYIRKKPGVGLLFVESHREALDRLLAETTIPEAFYYYWNDVVNAVGYTPKLLLMCSAIECLTRTGRRKKDWTRIEQILGKELTEELFGTKENSDEGLRNRLTHGEYLGPGDSGKNYVELIHNKIMTYFNEHVLEAPLLDLNVVAPQRHPWGSLEGGSWFLKRKDQRPLALKSVLADFTKKDVNHLEHHELVYDNSLATTY